jgi:hypothetical protein
VRLLLPLLFLVLAVLSGQIVDAVGGPGLLRALLFGAFLGVGVVLAAKWLREGDRR